MFHHKKKDEDIGPSTGIMKWINKFFRFILAPFIHPLFFISLLIIAAILFVIPCQIYKISPHDIPQWYYGLLSKGYHQTGELLAPLTGKITTGDSTTDWNSANNESQNKSSDDIVDYAVQPQAVRPSFQSPEEDDTSASNTAPTAAVVNSDTPYPAVAPSVDDNQPKIYFKRAENGYTYLDKPYKISGRFTVISANDILVGSDEIFLFGIDFPAENKAQAVEYMMINFDKKNVECYVGAYNSNQKGAAICFYEDRNINQKMLDEGLAQNISLY